MPSEARERIVCAAMMFFARKGYASTSVSDILHDAGANAGSLYSSFPANRTYCSPSSTPIGRASPAGIDRRALVTFALTTKEGGVMLSRTDRTLTAFDDSVRMLRRYADALEANR